jgi:Fe(3+) dicitrate transport protein
MKKTKTLIFIIFNFIASTVYSQTTDTTLTTKVDSSDDTIYVYGSKKKMLYTPGSTTIIDSKELKKQENTDIGRILDKVPGVSIQEEDGLGLRPNIGLRGVHPHRSKKITLMEDGILIAPAPYASPAAYYFPTPTRANNLEIFKGSSSVKYGPNSIGGAVNLITRPISKKEESEIDLSLGLIKKAMIATSGTKNFVGHRLELHRIQSDGFMELSKGGDTGTSKNDAIIKLDYNLGKLLGGTDQKFSLKGSYANEISHETYLGTSLSDFSQNSKLRYAASKDDLITWNHTQAQLNHDIRINEKMNLKTTFYNHVFKRAWFKFNGLQNKRDLRTLLSENTDPSLSALLNGDRDGAGPEENLILGNNDRRYLSQGIQLVSRFDLAGDEFSNDLSIGVRIHRDYVKRNHTEKTAEMKSGHLSYLPDSLKQTSLTHDESRAFTAFADNEFSIGNFVLSTGLRIELVKNISHDPIVNSSKENNESVIIPGAGINYSITPNLVALLGVNRGVTLVGPGQDESINEEVSTNYETGLRYLNNEWSGEILGFYSDYSNLKGTCTFSSGCTGINLDQDFNGGQAEVLGIESQISTKFQSHEFIFPVSLNYTKTFARFSKDNFSNNEEWGNGLIKKGDPLPYISTDMVNFKIGMEYKRFSTEASFSWKGNMADQSVEIGRKIIPSHEVIDWSMGYQINNDGRLYAKIDNVLDKKYLTSLRPYGARGGKPQMTTIGFSQKF